MDDTEYRYPSGITLNTLRPVNETLKKIAKNNQRRDGHSAVQSDSLNHVWTDGCVVVFTCKNLPPLTPHTVLLY